MRAAREAHARECWDRIGNVARGCRGATEQERKFIQADSLPKRRRRGSLILGASISTLTAPAATRRGSFGGAPGDCGALRGPRCNVAARDMRRNPPLRDSSTQFTGVCRPKADLPELPLLAGRGRIADLRMAAAILGSESQTGREPPKCEIRRRRGARSGSAPAPAPLATSAMPTPVTFSSRATSVFASVAVCGKCAALSTSSRVMSIVRRRMWRCEARTRIEAARCVGFEAFAMSRTRHGLPSFRPSSSARCCSSRPARPPRRKATTGTKTAVRLRIAVQQSTTPHMVEATEIRRLAAETAMSRLRGVNSAIGLPPIT